MIYDSIKNAHLYRGLNKSIDKVLEIAAGLTPEGFETGRQEIDGKNLFINYVSYETKPKEVSSFEAHRLYADVMYMVEGSETIYVKPTPKLKNITKEYDPEIEALIADLDDDVTEVRLDAGMFCVLFPDDAHSPACICDEAMTVKKIIGKVKLN